LQGFFLIFPPAVRQCERVAAAERAEGAAAFLRLITGLSQKCLLFAAMGGDLP